eukprot:4822208-Amphidinium_carterae.1
MHLSATQPRQRGDQQKAPLSPSKTTQHLQHIQQLFLSPLSLSFDQCNLAYRIAPGRHVCWPMLANVTGCSTLFCAWLHGSMSTFNSRMVLMIPSCRAALYIASVRLSEKHGALACVHHQNKG